MIAAKWYLRTLTKYIIHTHVIFIKKIEIDLFFLDKRIKEVLLGVFNPIFSPKRLLLSCVQDGNFLFSQVGELWVNGLSFSFLSGCFFGFRCFCFFFNDDGIVFNNDSVVLDDNCIVFNNRLFIIATT
jgi:hypothetical protein